MKLISHRGNTQGRIPEKENTMPYLIEAMNKGYEIEIDVWYNNDAWYLGHDSPQHLFPFPFLKDTRVWVHCKNLAALEKLQSYKDINYFWHQTDLVTLTSHGYIWAYPGNRPIKNSIAVMPEINNDDVTKCIGICSDIIENYKYLRR